MSDFSPAEGGKYGERSLVETTMCPGQLGDPADPQVAAMSHTGERKGEFAPDLAAGDGGGNGDEEKPSVTERLPKSVKKPMRF